MTSVADKLIELGIEPLNGAAFTPFSEAQAVAIEAAIGAPVPEDYKHFLLRFGGSAFSSNVSCASPGERLRFGQFFSFDELSNAIDYLKETLPEKVFPIGDNCGDIVFCLGASRADAGKVFSHNTHTGWHADAEAYLERGEPVPTDIRYQTVEQIATTFEQFVLGMARGK